MHNSIEKFSARQEKTFFFVYSLIKYLLEELKFISKNTF